MSEKDTFGTFFSESARLAREWVDDRARLYKLKGLRTFSRSAAYLVRVLITVVLVFFFLLFLGITSGFWLSELTGSYVKGFGLVTAVILFVATLLFLFKKTLFVDPIIRNIIRRTASGEKKDTH